MIYHQDKNITIRSMNPSDAQAIYDEFYTQNWHPTLKTYENYYTEQENKQRYVFVAEYDNNIAGYTTLLPNAHTGPFANKRIPEIVDLNVFRRYQRKGIGNKILYVVEKIASEISSTISLGVGVHGGYGSAQRMYIKRGYIPDGSGVWYKNEKLEQYQNCCNDDDLILYLSKTLAL